MNFIALRLQNFELFTPNGARKLLTIDRLVIAAGDRVALLGINGCGKSTLLNAIHAAYDPNREHYDGRSPVDVVTFRNRRRSITATIKKHAIK